MNEFGAAHRAGLSIPFSAEQLTGRSDSHVVAAGEGTLRLHRAVVAPFDALREAAARHGMDLAPVSTFRSFEQQRVIWNEKWTGRRALLGRDGGRLDAAALSPAARVEAILWWSAAPGASRHHWGTELDLYDRAAVPPGYRPALTRAEYAPDGPFGRLAAWLAAHMARFGFYAPYVRDRGGVQPEPWHVSHWPTAGEAARRLRLATLRRAISGAQVEGRDALLATLPQVYRRYVRNVERVPRLSARATTASGGRASAP